MTTDFLAPAAGRGSFTADVDRSTGRIRARGHLTLQGADLLGGTAQCLRDGGHRRVVIDLAAVPSADAAALDVLSALRRRFAAVGGDLVLEHAPPAH